ncbi:hypothetical protein [Sinorhizobium glycinis]|nr:hypothetical protein [Sinorhizobium glycinis]
MMLPPDRVITLEPPDEPDPPSFYWLAPVVCFAAIVLPLFL